MAACDHLLVIAVSCWMLRNLLCLIQPPIAAKIVSSQVH
jgi:hypothetical protein